MMGIKTCISTVLLFLIFTVSVSAQPIGNIQCGDIVEGEVVAGQSQTADIREINGLVFTIAFDSYTLDIQAGTRVDLTVTPLGNTFNAVVVLLDSGGNDIVGVNENAEGQAEQFIDYAIGSSNQVVRILGAAPGANGFESIGYSLPYSTNNIGVGHYFGAYEIRLGCTLRDNTIILPGEKISSANETANTQSFAQAPAFSGFGFPGLNSVDFSGAVNLPLIPATPMTGALTPTGGEILGFQFDANANDSLQLDFARLSGNLNLGLVVLSANNEVVFQSSLVISETLSTRLTLPSAGQYTIGVFRIDLLPPANPEATAFQITGTLNP